MPNTAQSEQQKAVEIPSPPSAPQQQSKSVASIPNEPHSTPLAPSQPSIKRARKIEPSDGNTSKATPTDPRNKKLTAAPQSSPLPILLTPPPPAPTLGKENQQPQLPIGQTSSKALHPQNDNNDLETELTRFYESIRAATAGMPE